MADQQSEEWRQRQRSVFSDRDRLNQLQDLQTKYARLHDQIDDQLQQTRCELDDARQRRTVLQDSSNPDDRVSLTSLETRISKAESRQQQLLEQRERLKLNQALGERSIRSATIHVGPDGAVTIESEVAPPQPRLGYEHENRSGLESHGSFHRAHGQGSGTGFESDVGISHASPEVNLAYQNAGIEQFIRETYEARHPETTLRQKTVITTHEGTRELKEAQYEIHASRPGHPSMRIYSASITVDRPGARPVAEVEPPASGWQERYLKPATRRQAPQRTDLSGSLGSQSNSATQRPSEFSNDLRRHSARTAAARKTPQSASNTARATVQHKPKAP